MEECLDTYDDMMHGCIERKRRAQAAFYDMFAPELHVTACRMLGSAEESEEVVQEILLRTLTNPVLLINDRAGMARRLRRMTINECIDHLRKRHVTWEELDGQTDVCCEPDMDELLIQEEQSNRLRQAIETLSQQNRTVLQLAVLEEMDHEDIASLLHITTSGVRAHLTRAKQKLINYFRNEKQ